MFNRNIAIDKDDTLNYLTLDICKMAKLSDVPTLDVIKTGRASEAFYKARKEFFNEPANFSNPPYGLANDIVSKASEYGFNPLICTKTMSGHVRGNEIVAHKFDFLNKYFEGVEAMIVMGRKFPDAVGMVDDSLSNCLAFNKTMNRPFIAWNHQIATLNNLDDFYNYTNEYADFVETRKDIPTKESVLIYDDVSGEYPFVMLHNLEDNNKDNFVYVGTYLNTKAIIPTFQKIYFDKRLIKLSNNDREEALSSWAYESTFAPNESTAMIRLISYNIRSAILS